MEHTFYLFTINKNVVGTVIRTMKSRKCPGYDKKRAEILEKSDNMLSEPIEFLIHQIFEIAINFYSKTIIHKRKQT